MSKKQLSKELAAALHSGAVIDPAILASAEAESDDAIAAAAALKATTDAAAKLKLETDAAAEKTKLEALVAAGGAEGEAAKTKLDALTAEAAKPTTEAETPKDDKVGKKGALITHLQTELNTLRTTHSDVTVKMAAMKLENDTMKLDAIELNKAVQAATVKLCVALNVSPALVESLTGKTLCETYQKLSNDLGKKFKIGATSDTGENVEEPKAVVKPAANPARQAAVRATGLRK